MVDYPDRHGGLRSRATSGGNTGRRSRPPCAMQAAALMEIVLRGRRQVTSKGLWARGCLSKHARGLKTRRNGRTILELPVAAEPRSFFQEGWQIFD